MSRKMVTIDGNQACTHVAYATSEIITIYPITPSTPGGPEKHLGLCTSSDPDAVRGWCCRVFARVPDNRCPMHNLYRFTGALFNDAQYVQAGR